MTKIQVVTNNILAVTKFYFVTNIIYNNDKSCHYNFIISHKKIFVTNIYIFYFYI